MAYVESLHSFAAFLLIAAALLACATQIVLQGNITPAAASGQLATFADPFAYCSGPWTLR